MQRGLLNILSWQLLFCFCKPVMTQRYVWIDMFILTDDTLHTNIIYIQSIFCLYICRTVVPASAPPPDHPTWTLQSWTLLQRWRWDSDPWSQPGCLWRTGRKLTQASEARWDPSSSSSWEFWASLWDLLGLVVFLQWPAMTAIYGEI